MMSMCVIEFLLVVHPSHILVHPMVHRAHRLKSADLKHRLCNNYGTLIV